MTWEFFDIAADPEESKDLKKSQKEAFEGMKARYKEAVGRLKDGSRTDKLKGKNEHKRC